MYKKITLLLLLIPAITFANTGDKKKHEKSKTITKSYKVNPNATVDIKNKYGNITVTTWNQNKVAIEVKITVKGNDLDRVESQLSKIDVDFNSSSNLVQAKTRFERNNSWNFWGKKNVSYQVNYTIKMPESNNASLNNDYGAISLDKLRGTADINCDYGKITIGDLFGKNSNINLDYCSASSIESMVDGSVNIDYSKISIDKAKNVDLNTDYSTARFGMVEKLNVNADYGAVEAKSVGAVMANGDYTNFKLGTVTESLTINADYGSIKVEELAKGFDFVDIKSEYAGIKLGTQSSNNFSFIIELQYAGFKHNKNNVDIKKSIEKNSKKYYEGTYGKGSSSSRVKIKSEYGSVTLKEVE